MSLARQIGKLFSAGAGSTVDSSLLTEAMPTGAVLSHAGSSAPTGWLLCYGQAVSRTTYAALFAVIGTTYGVGDGSTTFNVPDLRGRAVAGKDDMGGSAAGRLNVTLTGTKASTSSGVITGLSSTAGLVVGMQAFGTGIGTSAQVISIDSSTQVTLSVNSTSTGSTSIRFGVVDGATVGAVGGSHTHLLGLSQIPGHTHTSNYDGSSGVNTASNRVLTTSGGNGVGTYTTGSAGGGDAHPNVQPTIVLNKIIKT